jgi:uncharacterized protein (DUF1501 family)
LDLSPATADLLRHVYHDDALFRSSVEQAITLAGAPTDARDKTAPFSFAASQLLGETRIAALSLGGWDTHQNQPGRFTRQMDTLVAGFQALRTGLGPTWDETLVLAVTEFGRTAAQNGTRGTDHGTGGTMILAGGALRGKRIFGDWPGLAEAELLGRRDLRPTRDLRAYAAWGLAGLFGLDRDILEGTVFPALQMGEDPKLLS